MSHYPTLSAIESYLKNDRIWEVLDSVRHDAVFVPDPKELTYSPKNVLEVSKLVTYVALYKIVNSAAYRYYRRNVPNVLPNHWREGIADRHQNQLAVINDRIITLRNLIVALRHRPIKVIIHAYYCRFGGFEFVRSMSQRGVAVPHSAKRASAVTLKAQYVASIARDLAVEGISPTAENILEIVVAVEQARCKPVTQRAMDKWKAIIARHLHCYQVMYPVPLEPLYATVGN